MDRTKLKAVADVLDAAANLITPEGSWMQGDYSRGECWCALGAIRQAGNYTGDINAAAGFLSEYLDMGLICDWNDDPDRTQAEVVAKLREAAAAARAGTA